MSGGYTGSNGRPDSVVEVVARQAELLREESKPTGAQINKTIGEVQKLVEDLSDQVDDLLVTKTYGREAIDQKITDLGQAKANASHSHTQDQVSGTWTKGVDTPQEVKATTARVVNVYASSAPNTSTNNISGTRVTAWLQSSDGLLGNTGSSERWKTNIVPVDIDPEAVLSVQPIYYQWVQEIAERARRADLPMFHAQYDRDYHVATEVGFIAERLHEAGLWQFVYYDRDEWGKLIIGPDGEPVPAGIHYINWGIAQQVVLQWLAKRLDDTDRRLAAVERQLGG